MVVDVRPQGSLQQQRTFHSNPIHPLHPSAIFSLVRRMMMMTRRHNGVIQQDAASTCTPSKDELRRRLFEEESSPQKSSRSKRGKGTASSFQLSRKATLGFVCFGVVLLLGVHGFLLKALLSQRTPPSETAAAPLLPTQPLRRPTTATTTTTTNRIVLPKRTLQPLEEKDWNQYTIRINTWRRPEQLLVSVDWHSKCPGVAQIQIVWCDQENEPPKELENYENVIIERHEVNSLNERFNVMTPSPTLGILSIDDDVLRPCEAIDVGFFKWTQSPDRMVGFDGRIHVENEDGSWKYGYMSTTEKANRYSMSLTRCCFIHKDYMDIYMRELPPSILDSVATHFNCEDVAMSFLISSLTDGMPPLLADTWAIKSMIKLYVEKKISGGHDHKHLRDICVDSFAQILGLKDDNGSRRLKTATFYHKKESFFDCGDVPHHKVERDPKSKRQLALEAKLEKWRGVGRDKMQREVNSLMSGAAINAFKHGLIQKTDPWKERYQHKKGNKR